MKKVLIWIIIVVFAVGFIYKADDLRIKREEENFSIDSGGEPIQLPQIEVSEKKDLIETIYNSNQKYDIFDVYWYTYNIAPTYYEDYLLNPVASLRSKYLHDYKSINKTYRDDKVYYTYFDIDKDGTDELIFTTQDNDKNTEPLYYIDAIYRHIDGGLKKVREIHANSEGVYGGLSGTYEYEELINNVEGEEIYITEDNHIVCKGKGTYELKNGKLKKSSTNSSIKKDYDWTLLTGQKKENNEIRNEYIRIINEAGYDTRFDLLRMYDENLELYMHKTGERTAKILRYDGKKMNEIEVYAPVVEKKYIGTLIYQPMGNRLETSYLISKNRIRKTDQKITTYVIRDNTIDYKEEVIKQYTLKKDGTWKLRGEASNINGKETIDNAIADYADHHDEYVGEVQPEELTKEEVLWLLEKY